MTARSAAIAVLSLSLASSLGAEAQREIKFKSRDLEKVKAQIDEKREERERLRKEAQAISDTLKKDQSKARDIEDTLVQTKEKNSELEIQVARKKNEQDRLLASAETAENDYGNAIQTYYVASLIGGVEAPLPVLSRQVIAAQGGQLTGLRKDSSSARERLRELLSVQSLVRTEVDRQQSQLTDIRQGSHEHERALAKTMTRQEVLEKEVRDLEKTAEELASLIDNLRDRAKEEAVRDREARQKKIASGSSPIVGKSLPWPVKGVVTTKFGRQDHPTLGTPFVSNGILIRMSSPDTVSAVSDGKVLYAGRFMSYGSMAVVEHPGDWYTVYGQLGKWVVEKGQQVKKGDPIGMARVRPEGGAEAYFELRFYGKPTDPLPWLQP